MYGDFCLSCVGRAYGGLGSWLSLWLDMATCGKGFSFIQARIKSHVERFCYLPDFPPQNRRTLPLATMPSPPINPLTVASLVYNEDHRFFDFVKPQTEFTVGRGPHNDIQLPGPLISTCCALDRRDFVDISTRLDPLQI